MMRPTTLKVRKASVVALVSYYAGLAADQLHRDGRTRGPIDYYLDPNEPPRRWWGRGCEEIGLAGDVHPEQMEAMLQARHPGNGCRLGRGFGTKSARAFDATFSAPKSVSVLWALSPASVRAVLLAAHDAAVIAALAWLEQCGCVTRRGTNGLHQVDARGLVVALFRQHTSREADPQLHTHALIWAKVQDLAGKWLSLDARFLKYPTSSPATSWTGWWHRGNQQNWRGSSSPGPSAGQSIVKGTLNVHADRGTSMTSKGVAELLADLGIGRTHSRPHVSNDNPFSEAAFKTLKYCPAFPERFGSIHDARSFCEKFFSYYNHEHRHSGIGLHTAASVHYGTATEIRAKLAVTLDAAYAANPGRFRHRRPTPPKLPTVAWVNKPTIESDAQKKS